MQHNSSLFVPVGRIRPLAASGALALLLLLGTASVQCTSGTGPAAAAKDTTGVKETQTGLASFYGRAFEGEKTASGETFRSGELVAAHPTYPLGTRARVTNLEGGGTVQVRIIDRGPTDENVAEGVIIDLSKGAAEKLGMVQDGRVRVKVEVLQWGTNEYKQ
ncbi:MAG TPA: septal ring lytic transglycosylase RlpA family protein [Chitinophagaceae bacterium]|jgi:rare lipoprotein A|nr:septal ring lytic transglycosylase RlpA family protein [Chitinophagaceae bacterium]